MTPRRTTAKRLRFALPLLLLVVLLGPLLATQTYGQDALVTGNAQVIAQGLTAPPADRSAWRVVQQKIPTRLNAVPSVRMQSSAGFLLADNVDVFVVDQRTKLRSRLAPGEAQYVATGANQTWASLADNAGKAWTLELVDRDVIDVAPGAKVIYGSGSFSTEPGDYDLDLVRAQLQSGDKSTIPSGSYPTLVFVTSGSVTVTSSKADDSIHLDAGDAQAIKGDLTIKARGDKPATYVAAYLGDPLTGGDAVPTVKPTEKATKTSTPDDGKATKTATPEKKATKTPTPKATATADLPGINDGASIRIAIRLCPAGMTYFAINPSACVPASGDYHLYLITPDGDNLSQSQASKHTKTFVRWSGLDAGIYILVVDSLPDGYLSYSLDGYLCCTTKYGYTITLDKNQLADGTLYLFQSDWGVGAPQPTAIPTTAAAQPNPVPTQSTGTVDNGVDSDGDGLSDYLEINVFGTSPFLVDSDGDTIPDGTEAFGLNGYLTAPALYDTDGDGVSDGAEIQNGTDPLDPSSH